MTEVDEREKNFKETTRNKKRNAETFLNQNENAGARTQDLRIKSPLLYQLSYVPTRQKPQKEKQNARNV